MDKRLMVLLTGLALAPREVNWDPVVKACIPVRPEVLHDDSGMFAK